MPPSQPEKKHSDIEMGAASKASPASTVPDATQSFVDGFRCFKDKLSRRNAEKRARAEATSVPSSLVPPSQAPGAVVPEQNLDVQARPSVSSTALIVISGQEDAVESIPPPSDKKEIVLGLLAPSVAPLPKGRTRAGPATGSAKMKRCAKSEEGEPSGLLSQHRSKFVSLIDGMLGDCGSEVASLSKELESSQEALKGTEAVLQTIENTHAAQTSQFEVRIGDLERDLGKTASLLLKMKKEKKHKSLEVRRLQQKIQSLEGMGACRLTGTVDPRDDYFARLTKMAILFDSLTAVRKRDLALAGIEGSLSEIQLFKGDNAPSIDLEEARLLSCKKEWVTSGEDFDSILAGLKSVCTLVPDSEGLEDQGHAVEDREVGADEVGSNDATKGGDGETVPTLGEFEDEDDAIESV
ncbi:Uncharacterized protein Rs2_41020 [Raphanus sativus]|nr:Uncharacterized protein Rs2_41020 [Raphanus sativus]